MLIGYKHCFINYWHSSKVTDFNFVNVGNAYPLTSRHVCINLHDILGISKYNHFSLSFFPF